jgi:hypothetical protein
MCVGVSIEGTWNRKSIRNMIFNYNSRLKGQSVKRTTRSLWPAGETARKVKWRWCAMTTVVIQWAEKPCASN